MAPDEIRIQIAALDARIRASRDRCHAEVLRCEVERLKLQARCGHETGPVDPQRKIWAVVRCVHCGRPLN